MVNRGIALPVLAAVGLATTLGGCTDIRRAFGMEKVIPDEFAVVSRAPLAIPPDYSLRPPQPGAAPSQEVAAQDKAKEAVFRAGPQQAGLPPAASERSPGEGALLRDAGAPNADPSIRSHVSDDTALTPENQRSFVDKLLFWRTSGPPASNDVIDPNKEADRIKQAQATGAPIAPDAPGAASADATQQPAPTIERKKSTSIFNIF
ncbi:MAG TPA: DUF3035 domain-containing protein [Stellaceae bacterium]|nr:DUF3035 domain-containing protein [Stellaceae bacterium]